MSGNDIALAVFDTFAGLRKGKPNQRSNGKQEWTVLASVVAIKEDEDNKCIPITLATGVKTIPEKARMYSAGTIVHDLHAEILALRLFNLYLLEEAMGFPGEDITETSANGMRRIKDGVKLALLITEPPCGDASMTYVRDKLDDSTDWDDKNTRAEKNPKECESIYKDEHHDKEDKLNYVERPTKKFKLDLSTLLHRGRHLINQVGIVRTKPGRKDSPVSYSKSCSDKLCLKQLTGITNAFTSLFYENTFLDFLVVSHKKFHSTDFDRCFYERFAKKLPQCHPLQTLTYDCDFEYSQDSDKVASPLSILHISSLKLTQVLSNGVKDGAFRKNKPAQEHAQSIVCNQALIRRANPLEWNIKHYKTYQAMKTDNIERQALKKKGRDVLTKGELWIATTKDDFDII